MSLFAVVPVKRLDSAKSRLRRVVVDRPALALAMLRNVLDALLGSGTLDAVAVVSPDPRVRPTCDGAEFLLQPGAGLNRALDQGRRWAMERGASGLLVVLADLPDLNPQSIRELVSAAPARGAVAAPDRADAGTNALLLRPPDLFPFRFGPDSLRLHRAEAKRLEIPLVLHRSPETGNDLDTPAHLLERLAR